MSIATQITRINNAKSNIRTAIIGKGVSVPAAAKIGDEEYTSLQDAIDAEELRADTEEKRLAGLISGNTTEIGKLDTRLDTAEGKITTAEGKISALETASAKHATQANLKAATDRLDAIEADYLKAADTYIFDCGGAN